MKKKTIDITNALSSNFLFKAFTYEQLSPIEKFSSIKTINKNDILFNEEEKASKFFIIINGKFKVFKTSPEGKEQTIHILGPGDLIAEAAIFDKETYPANCQSLAKGKLVEISKADFLSFLNNAPSLSLTLLGQYSKKLRQLVSLVEDLSLNDVQRRFSKYLLNHATSIDNKYECDLPTNKKELASLLGTTPESLSRAINLLKKEKIIGKTTGKIQILDKKRLKQRLS